MKQANRRQLRNQKEKFYDKFTSANIFKRILMAIQNHKIVIEQKKVTIFVPKTWQEGKSEEEVKKSLEQNIKPEPIKGAHYHA